MFALFPSRSNHNRLADVDGPTETTDSIQRVGILRRVLLNGVELIWNLIDRGARGYPSFGGESRATLPGRAKSICVDRFCSGGSFSKES